MNKHDRTIIHSSVDWDWRTPLELYKRLYREFAFQTDAAADARNHLTPAYFFGPGSSIPDALLADWYKAPGPFFLNPPYSRQRYRETGDPAMDIGEWARKCFIESERGCTVVGLFPFAPQTEWYRLYVMGHTQDGSGWRGHAAMEEWRIPHRVCFLRPDGSKAGNAGVNSVILVWRPNPGFVGPWTPAVRYWDYR